jgi:hypothetical protein
VRRSAFLRDSLEPVVYTKDQIVLKENAHRLIGAGFCSLALVVSAGFLRDLRTFRDMPFTVMAGLMCSWLLLLGLYGSIESTVDASRLSGVLRIKRRLGWLRIEHRYSLSEVSQFFERKTLRGNGLRMKLLSGKNKSLTLFTEYTLLGPQVGLLNHILAASRHYAKSADSGSAFR